LAPRTGLDFRRARLIEIDPDYVDVAILRWQRLTGKTAVNATTGIPFSITPRRRCSAIFEHERADIIMSKDRKRDYEVGNRKPPLHRRFKPGQSANPAGGKKGVPNWRLARWTSSTMRS
jgi:hypothetical protein